MVEATAALRPTTLAIATTIIMAGTIGIITAAGRSIMVSFAFCCWR